MREYERIKAAIIRGGTSKAVFISQNELPTDPTVRDQVILSIYGGNDARQVDGLGGADALTSKFSMVQASKRNDADVEYTFGQVGIGTGTIDYNSNCGNILSAVGPYAIDEGMVPAVEPLTTVRILNTNTNKIIEAEVPVLNGRAKIEGPFRIDGVPGSGAKILLNFIKAEGAKTGALFPTGKRKEILEVSFGNIEVSVLDVTTPVVFIHASSLELSGIELPEELSIEQLHQLEEIRSLIAYRLGFVKHPDDAVKQTPASPKIIMVSPATSYVNSSGITIPAEEIDFVSRAMSMQKMHRAFPVTGGLCTAVASKIEGTIVQEISKARSQRDDVVKVGHPSGSMEFSVVIEDNRDEILLQKTAVARTARRLMEGFAYVPSSQFWKS
ncbi:2-methylaconitate cis-trans isomerase PrpF family protein [Alkalicoccobacillus gibsonii]|uniref:2-methylaconitate cis-trans isomerase PrpF family protein n=1 Tax=Alkalicoccobacillus gibsonii TaxID=79881 RepID=UPI001932BAC4|nr:PrpF domain-containing protein [Alkalicoccobacillus gibsonii]MBM0065568.1 3-methylitaconate isomerase [Alkalicoccobacillus gibsonii]